MNNSEGKHWKTQSKLTEDSKLRPRNCVPSASKPGRGRVAVQGLADNGRRSLQEGGVKTACTGERGEQAPPPPEWRPVKGSWMQPLCALFRTRRNRIHVEHIKSGRKTLQQTPPVTEKAQ